MVFPTYVCTASLALQREVNLCFPLEMKEETRHSVTVLGAELCCFRAELSDAALPFTTSNPWYSAYCL
jgi:hypothetical protein